MPAPMEAIGARDSILTTPSDVLEQPFNALKVITPGDVAIVTLDGNTRVLTFSTPGEIWPQSGKKVLASNTDAEDIYRLIY